MAAPRVSAFRPDQLWQQAREPLLWLDSALRILWVNRAFEALTGQPADALLGQSCGAHGPARDAEPMSLAASLSPPPEALTGGPSGTFTLLPLASGDLAWRRVEFWPVHDLNGSLIGLLGQVRLPDDPASMAESAANVLRVRLMEVRDQLHRFHGIDSLIGSGPAHERLMEQVKVAAACTAPVLIIGEPGTGKLLTARTIHQLGPNRQQPFVGIDCEALPPEVLDRELFSGGRSTGSRGGAGPRDEHPPRPRARLGLADGSTLMLGDLLALPRDLQTRLAESLDDRVRLIVATEGNPETAVNQDRLRHDLFYAVSVLVVRLLPLRERRHDLMLLAQHRLERANQRTGGHCAGFTSEAIATLEAHDWPGNLRELARVIDAAHARFHDRLLRQDAKGMALIDRSDLPASIRGHFAAAYLPPPAPSPVKPLDELLTEIERRLIETALGKSRQNKSRAAELLGISRPRLYRRIKELNLPDDAEPEIEAVPGASDTAPIS